MNECDQRELWKELRQMVNKVSENVKALYESHNDVLDKVKALVESVRPWMKSSQECKRFSRTWWKMSYNFLIQWNSKNKSSSKNLLLLLQAGMSIFMSKWIMIYMYTLPLKFSPKNQQRRWWWSSKNQFLMHQWRLPLKSLWFKNWQSKCRWSKNLRYKHQQF